MNVSIEELGQLVASALRGEGAVEKPPTAAVLPPLVPVFKGTTLLVADRGFVYVGAVVIQGDYVRVTNCRNVRYWGTKEGLGQLARTGPTSETKLDAVGEIIVPLKAVIHFVPCQTDW